MKKQSLIFLILIFIIFLISIYIISNQQNKNPEVCFEENCFLVEIALTQEEKAKGLMFREFLNEDKGMLFVYDEEKVYNFWMKNTLIPLDIIWINSNKEVVYIKHEAQPCNGLCESISPGKNALFVLEINAGITEKLNIIIGDKIKFYNIKK